MLNISLKFYSLY